MAGSFATPQGFLETSNALKTPEKTICEQKSIPATQHTSSYRHAKFFLIFVFIFYSCRYNSYNVYIYICIEFSITHIHLLQQKYHYTLFMPMHSYLLSGFHMSNFGDGVEGYGCQTQPHFRTPCFVKG